MPTNLFIDWQILKSIVDRHPLQVTSDTPALKAIALMSRAEGKGCVLVVDGGHLVGIFTETDTVKAIAAGVNLSQQKIGGVMSQPEIIVVPSQTQNSGIELDAKRSPATRHLPVVDRAGKVWGLLIREQLDQLYAREARSRFEPSQTARQILFDKTLEAIGHSDGEGRYAKILQNIALGVSQTTGENFLQSLVQYLTQALGVEYAFIGELIDSAAGRIRTVAGYGNNRVLENFEYDLAHTPCERVFQTRISIYPHQVRQRFPKDSYLVEIEAEAYMGICLCDRAGRAMGLIAILSRHPLRDTQLLEKILKIFAARTSAELERRQAELALRDSENRISTLISNLPGYVYRLASDRDCAPEFISEGVFAITGYRQEEYLEARSIACRQEIHADDRERICQAVRQSLAAKRPYECVYRIVTKSEREKWVWERGRGIYGENGELLHLEGFVTDISEQQAALRDRQATEDKLREREQFLRSIYDGAEQAIFVIETNAEGEFRYLGFNRVSERFSGVSEERVRGKTPEEAFGKEMGTAFRQNYSRCLQAQTSISYEERLFFEGRTIWTLTTLSPLRDREGRIYRIVGTATDISDRKRVQEALIQSERQFRGIFNSTFEFMGLLTIGGTIAEVNQAALKVIDADRADVLGQFFPESPWWTHFPEQQERLRQAIASAAKGEFVRFESKHIWADGTLAFVDFSLKPLFDEAGKVVMLIPEGREITDRKQAEEALRESEERWQFALEGSGDGIWDWDAQTNEVFYSRRWKEMLGFEEDEIGNDLSEWDKRVHPDDKAQVYEKINQYFAGESDRYVSEHRLLCKDGRYKWILDRGKIISRREDGSPLRIIGTHTDISDRKAVEAALKQQLEREQLIAEIAQDIRQTLDYHQVLQRTVEQVRKVLQTDRAIVFRFQPNWQGTVVTESVGSQWTSMLSTTIYDPCFAERYVRPYCEGRISFTENLYESHVDRCYLELLEPFQVKANLVVPILQGERLWGLLIVHHCATPRKWQKREIDLLQQLANQLSLAIQQSELYQQTRQELIERRRAQDALQESEERFRSLSAAAPIGIRYTNADGICLYVNSRWEQMSGLAEEDCLANGWMKAIHPEDRQGIVEKWEKSIQKQQEFAAIFRFLTPKNKIRWISAHAAPMRSATGQFLGYVSTEEDITDRKLAEQKIREQAALIDIATDAISVRDLENRALFWSRGAERLYGWTTEEILGQKIDRFLYRDLDPTAFELAFKQTLEQGDWQGELEKSTKTGKKILVMSRWTLVRDESGQPKSILVVNNDITEKKQLEQQFYRAQRLESLGTLASGIAHDFNNLLTPILAIAQLLPRKFPDLDRETEQLLAILGDNARRGANLVKQIVSFARGTEGKRVPLEVRNLLVDVVNIAQRTFPKSIDISLEIPPKIELWTISADATQIHQVLMNLMVNARDAMPDGGRLTIAAENRYLDEQYVRRNLEAREGYYTVITVSDTGIGIPPELRERIFDPFFTTKAVGKGTGLGLATVLGIVSNYGGFVRVASEVDRGSEFSVFLPVAEETSMESLPNRECQKGNGELILLVDDEDAIREISKTALENYNYKILLAKDGVEAIALYSQHHQEIAAAVVDMMMPNMDGLTAIQALRKIDPQVKAIATSGLAANRELALAAEVETFLLKPYSIKDLSNALSQLISSDS